MSCYGDRRGDELPDELITREGRRKVLADAKRRLIERRASEAAPDPKVTDRAAQGGQAASGRGARRALPGERGL